MPLIIAAAATVVSAGVGIKSAIDNKAAQEDQATIDSNIGLQQRQKEIRRKTRERRIQMGRLKQRASTTGVADSSGEIGAAGALSTQFAAGQGAANFAGAVTDASQQIQSDLADKQTTNALIQAGASVVKSGAMLEAGTQDENGKGGAISTMFS